MSACVPSEDSRLAELLCDRATGDLAPRGADELQRLLEASPDIEAYAFDVAAAALTVGWTSDDAVALPEQLRGAILNRYEQSSGDREMEERASAPAVERDEPIRMTPAAASESDSSSGFSINALGWLAAAAAIAIAVLSWVPGRAVVLPITDQRLALLDEAGDALQVEWAAPTEAGYENVKGDVVWSNSRQAGFMRLSRLNPNDSSKAQYQLWIVDPTRDEKPIDGGVFDIPSDGEVIVPIDAKLRVNRPAVFAITLEQPGGVVVSDGPLLIVAKVPTDASVETG